MNEEPAEQSTRFLLEILAGKNRAQTVSTAAALGIADHLADRPRSASELALEIDCDADALARLLHMLTSLGFCEGENGQAYSLTEHGKMLKQNALGPLAAFVGAPEQWDPWSRLREAMQPDSDTAFRQTLGTDLYAFLANNPEAARRYDRAVDAFTRPEATALTERFDFSDAQTIIDVGGGTGSLLVMLLEKWPHVNGVLFDLPHVVARAKHRFGEDLRERIRCVEGNFLEEVPTGADTYLLKHVLHNWDDDQATALLGRCSRAMGTGGRVLVIESMLSPDNRPDAARMLDLEMLVLTGGRERRKPELRKLFHAAGLKLNQIEPLTESSWLLVGSLPEEGGATGAS